MFFHSLFICLFSLCSSCTKDDIQETTPTDPKPKNEYTIPTSELVIRDPFIIKDEENQLYYLNANANPSFEYYISEDLKKWKYGGKSYTRGADFWGQQDFWAPDAFHYKDKYYIIATFSAEGKNRGSSILVSEDIGGPYEPLVNEPITPEEWMCLDATLYIDDEEQPWLLYAREWLEVTDGEVYAQKLSEDLKSTIADPVFLFSASEADWVGTITAHGVTGYVTDAPFIHRTKSGSLVMLWSSFAKNGKYSIGLATSASGELEGPWIQSEEPLNDDDGGHAMLFESFEGELMISYHAPNSHPSRPQILQVGENNGSLTIIK